MRKITIVFVFLSLVALGQIEEPSLKTLHLNGKVKSVDITYFHASLDSLEVKNTFNIRYDESGNYVEQRFGYMNNSPSGMVSYSYDKKGMLLSYKSNTVFKDGTKEEGFFKNNVVEEGFFIKTKTLVSSVYSIFNKGDFQSRVNTSYANGKAVEKLFYYGRAGNLVEKYMNTYNAKGRLILMRQFLFKDSKKVKEVSFRYNSKGLVSEESVKISGISILKKIFSYNDKNLVEYIDESFNNIKSKTQYIYNFDAKGNYLRKEEKKQGKTIFVETRVINYYK